MAAPPKKIYTHSGQFHADEVCACALLQIIHHDKHLEIVRTRDEEVLAAALETDYMVDVGGVHDPTKLRFDHHQPSFDERFPGSETKMSSLGLVWLHYGKSMADPAAYERFYFRYIEGIDAHDNGVPFLPKGVRSNYRSLNLGQIISKMNGPDSYDHKDQAERFTNAVRLARVALDSLLESDREESDTGAKNRELIRQSIPHAKNRVLVVKERLVGSVNADLHDMPGAEEICFIVTPRDPDEGTWSIWTVAIDPSQPFVKKRYLMPEAEAKALVGDDLVFIHRACFVGACKSCESAVRVAAASNSL